MTILCPILYF